MQHLLRRERSVPRMARVRPVRPRPARPVLPPTPTLEELEARLVTTDETPVENIYEEKERRLLPGSLHDGWSGPPPHKDGKRRPFVAMSDVGLFFRPTEDPLAPDVLVSLDVSLPPDIHKPRGKSYLVWRYNKVPDVVMEIVSNKKGGELTTKLETYAREGIPWYVVHDPEPLLGEDAIYVFRLRGKRYVRVKRPFIEPMGLGLTLWHGVFEDREDTWLRWCDANGVLVPTGREMSEQERQRAEQERQRADGAHARAEQERQRAEQERQRAERERARVERLQARLRALGVSAEDDEG